MGEDRLSGIAQMYINRVSVGVQSLQSPAASRSSDLIRPVAPCDQTHGHVV